MSNESVMSSPRTDDELQSESSMHKRTKKPWTQEEDDSLLALTTTFGTVAWALIAEHLPQRTGKQCRERYHNHLQTDIKKGDWTEEEDRLIVELQAKYGNQWAKITKFLHGRSDNAVKNRWHAAIRSYNRAKAKELRKLLKASSVKGSRRKASEASTATKPVGHKHPLASFLYPLTDDLQQEPKRLKSDFGCEKHAEITCSDQSDIQQQSSSNDSCVINVNVV